MDFLLLSGGLNVLTDERKLKIVFFIQEMYATSSSLLT